MNKRIVRYPLIGLLAMGILGLTVVSSPIDTVQSAALTATVSLVATGIPAGTSNKVWTPQTQDFNGVSMVLVPAGCFMMGSSERQIDYALELAKQYASDANREWFDDEKPVHEVCFEQPLWIDRTEVTQAQFKGLGGKAANASHFKGDNRPLNNVTWFEARDFCAQRGARLPTEAEWEYAARGPESLIYPWGNDFVADNTVYFGNSRNQTAIVGSHPGGVSWVGALDMSGNVGEWVSSLYQAYPYNPHDGREGISETDNKYVLRGSSWLFYEYFTRGAQRYWFFPDVLGSDLGFRCARTYN